jgi:hypothetical protein
MFVLFLSFALGMLCPLKPLLSFASRLPLDWICVRLQFFQLDYRLRVGSEIFLSTFPPCLVEVDAFFASLRSLIFSAMIGQPHLLFAWLFFRSSTMLIFVQNQFIFTFGHVRVGLRHAKSERHLPRVNWNIQDLSLEVAARGALCRLLPRI